MFTTRSVRQLQTAAEADQGQEGRGRGHQRRPQEQRAP